MTSRLAGGLCVLLLWMAAPASVASGASGASAATSDEILVNGDHVEYHEADRVVIGHGHIVLTSRDTRLTCDRAVVYLATKDAFLNGRVRITQSGSLLTGEDVLYNFETQKGTILRAGAVVEPWRAAGDRMDKVADNGFVARHGYLTTCDFEDPHYRIQSRQLRIIPGDRVIIKNAVIYLGPAPILYLPSYVHRLDDRRPRVALTPGYSKDWGPFLLSSWRYYLHENVQGRINLDYRERRHFAEGIDTRYRVDGDEDNAGILRYYYTHEHRITKGHRFSGTKKSPAVVEERYRTQWRHRWQLDRDTTATLEFHQAKDDQFIRDYFRREYEQDNHPKTYVQIVRSDPRYGVSLLGRKRVNRFETEIEQLPEIRYDIRPTAFEWRHPWRLMVPWMEEERPGEQPSALHHGLERLYYQSNSSYNAFYRQPAYAGVNDHVHRLDTFHQLSYPVQVLGALTVTPLVATRQTWYSKETVSNAGTLRGVFQTGMDVSTKFFRIFDVDSDFAGLDIHRVRHVITPSLSYRYTAPPTVAASHLPQFDSIDGLTEGNVLTPSLEQKLQTKHLIGGQPQSVDLARLGLGTTYNFKTKGSAGGRFGDITQVLELKPYPWLLVESGSTFTTHPHQRFNSFTMDMAAGPGVTFRADALGTAKGFDRRASSDIQLPWAAGFGWRWVRDGNTQVVAEAEFNVGPKWRLAFYERADVRRLNSDGSKFVNRPAESEFRIRRDLHEWTAEFVVNRRRTEGNSLLLVFRLKAFPEQPLEFERNYNRPKLGERRALFAG